MQTRSWLFLAGTFLVSSLITHAAAAPSVVTTNPASITTNSATLNGTANPNGLATTAWFDWGTSTNYGNLTAGQSLGAGSAAVAVSANLSALLSDTNYHYRLVASNSAGVAYGGDVIVTPTLLLYLYAGESWTYSFHDLPMTSQCFHICANPFDISSVSFGFLADSFVAGSSVRVQVGFGGTTDWSSTNGSVVWNGPGSSFSKQDAPSFWTGIIPPSGSVHITVLTGSVTAASVTFFAQHQTGSGNANLYQNSIVPTRNPQPATLGTQFVSSVSLQGVVVSADVNAHNLTTGLFLQFGTGTNYGSTSSVAFVDRDYVVRPTIALSNLAPGTTYHLRVVATNSGGTALGNDLVVTAPSLSTITTLPANVLRSTSAVLNAAASLNGLNSSAYFDWGATTSYGFVTAVQSLAPIYGTTNVAVPVGGLSSQSTYHARAVIYAAGVTNFGADVAFTTPLPPANTVITNLATDDVRGAIERGGLVTFSCDGVLALGSQIEIASDTCLDASGHAITISGSNVTRIFKVPAGTTFTLTNVTLANGRATNASGAIYNEGTVLAYHCSFVSNGVFGANGANGTNGLHGTNSSTFSLVTPGTPGQAGSPGQDALGGAIYSSGALSLQFCQFITNSIRGGNGGQGGAGGDRGMYLGSPANQGSTPGLGGTGGAGSMARGGAIASIGIATLQSCTFSNSTAAAGFGGVGGNTGNGSFADLAQGGSGGPGGVSYGGALYASGPLAISNTLFVASISAGGNAGSCSFVPIVGTNTDSGTAMGGALYVQAGGVVLANCTFYNNAALGGNGGNCAGDFVRGDATGGAIASAGTFQGVNLTIRDNLAKAASPYYGHGGYSLGGSIANTGGVFQIVNSILSGGASNNAFGAITDLGHNLSSDATPAWTSGTSLNNIDPLLLPLANNGGPTLTMAPRADSPALNTADCASAPATDQRGVARPNGPGCDIGAYEGPGVPQLQMQRESAATNVLRWYAESNRPYRVEESSNFSGWSPIATNSAGANGWLEFRVPGDSSPGFFRLIAQ